MREVKDDIAAVGRLAVVPIILEVVARTTGMRFTAVARVTDTAWTACAVRDEISFGLVPGGELALGTTICNEIRQHGQPVIFGSASDDPRFCQHPTPRQYGFESYLSIPIVRADGSFFGTLCAIDPAPAKLDDPTLLQTLQLFAQLIASQLDAQDLDDRRVAALNTAADTARQLDRENTRIAALLDERNQVAEVMERELKDTRRLRDVAARLIGSDGGSALYGEILDAALQIVDADAGTLQLLDPGSQTLTFLATRGFAPDILAHFARVDASSGSPCGVAMATGRRAMVVFDDPAVVDFDGSHKWHLDAGVRSAQSTPLVSRSGRPLGMFSTHWRAHRELNERELRFLDLLGRQVADLIERSQVQEALQASERELREQARRKDEFIAVLAHELRNPLAPIRTGVDLLRHAAADPALLEKLQPVMERQVHHMVRLVDDLLDVSRISSGKVQLQRETVTLGELVESALEAHRSTIAAAGIALQVSLDDPARQLNADPTRLSQVLSNILHNAAKFTPPGGTITLRAGLEPSVAGPVEQVIRVTDTGMGIAPAQLPAIFELFTQVRPDSSGRQGGMGIGLALARRLMALHGGSLEAASAGLGQGSEFVIRLPWSGTLADAPPAVAPEAQAAALGGLRVLIVDDNCDAAEAVAMLLELHGCETQVVHDASAILQTIEAFDPALVLLDIGLPGMNGHDACRLIRRTRGDTLHIAALTGWGQEDDQRRSQEAGFDTHLTKPVDFALLEQVAAQAAARRRPATAP